MGITIEEYFEGLQRQLVNQECWSPDFFNVFNHEAGTGKSRKIQQYIGKMTQNFNYKVLYVQLFTTDGELDNTVANINKWAGKSVSIGYTSQNTRDKDMNRRLLEAQVICITHNMYKQVCKGNHPNLVKDRDVLVIDEFPDLMDVITVTIDEVVYLWSKMYSYREARKTARMLMVKIEKGISSDGILYEDFRDKYYDRYRKRINTLMNNADMKKHHALLNKIKTLLNNKCLLYESRFYFFNQKYSAKMLKNNIVLDANAEFEYRYELSNKFKVCIQPKMFEYSNTKLYHYSVKTSKSSLANFNDFYINAIKAVYADCGNKVLFITDINNEQPLKEALEDYSRIENKVNSKIKYEIDHFGNILGKNLYSDFDTIAILKTPNFSYITYALNYLYYKDEDSQPLSVIKIFENDDVEKIRSTTLAGLIYQALKRINRDNSRETKIHLFCDNATVVGIVTAQLPSLNYIPCDFEIEKKRKKQYDNTGRKADSVFEKNVKKIKELLLNYKTQGIGRIKKQNLREQMGISNTDLSKVLKPIEVFLNENGIKNSGQYIIFD